MGVDDSVSTVSLNYNVFTSFLKARMTCVSGGENGDIPYYYDNLREYCLHFDPCLVCTVQHHLVTLQ
jgi:hypothetical protein